MNEFTKEPPLHRVVFFQVQNGHEKITKITEMGRHHFHRKEKLIFFVEDEKGIEFLDTLFWKTPMESFLPHTATSKPSQDFIVITKEKQNLNKAPFAFNLCSTPLLIDGPFRVIYDFEDLTHLSKKKFSKLRFDAYKKEGLLIESRTSP